jgi:hypothetical protein
MVVEMIKEKHGVDYYSYGTPDDYLRTWNRQG